MKKSLFDHVTIRYS